MSPLRARAHAARSLAAAGGSLSVVSQRYGISRPTVLRLARRRGLRYLATTRTTPLTMQHKQQRLAFARRHLRAKTNWHNVKTCPFPSFGGIGRRRERVVVLGEWIGTGGPIETSRGGNMLGGWQRECARHTVACPMQRCDWRHWQVLFSVAGLKPH